MVRGTYTTSTLSATRTTRDDVYQGLLNNLDSGSWVEDRQSTFHLCRSLTTVLWFQSAQHKTHLLVCVRHKPIKQQLTPTAAYIAVCQSVVDVGWPASIISVTTYHGIFSPHSSNVSQYSSIRSRQQSNDITGLLSNMPLKVVKAKTANK